jgi:Uma2 family endonuclease
MSWYNGCASFCPAQTWWFKWNVVMCSDLKHLTNDTYLSLPEMTQRYAIIDGELTMAASPNPLHQTIVQELFLKLDPFVRAHRLGRVFVAPLDLVIRRDPLRTRQPDLMFISRARRSIIGPQVIEGGPDLVIEVLSPANTRQELQSKLRDYQTLGVHEAWVVSPEARTVEVLQFSPGPFQRLGLYGLGDLIISQVLSDVRLTVDEIFPEFDVEPL